MASSIFEPGHIAAELCARQMVSWEGTEKT